MSINPQKNHSGRQQLPAITNGQHPLGKKAAFSPICGPEKKHTPNRTLLSPMRPIISPNDITDGPKTPTRHGQLTPLNREADNLPQKKGTDDVSVATKPSTLAPRERALSSNKEYSEKFEYASKENSHIWDKSKLLSDLSVSIGTETPGLGINIPTSGISPLRSLSPAQIYTHLNHLMMVGPPLGSGAFGEVREVTLINTPIATNMVAAAKFFSDYSEKGTASIRHEFDTLKSLQGKPGIIQLVNADMTIDGTLVGYAMERGDGTLKAALASAEFSVTDTVKLAKDLVTGGCSLEEAQIVHRDGKPDNVVKVSDGLGNFTWKKVDFGLALQEGSPFKDGGTLLYRSPESYGGLNTDDYQTASKQDVFADGLILAEALLKQLPPNQDFPKTIIHARNPENPGQECNKYALMMRVSQEYKARFYMPAVERVREVQRQFPESTALVDLAIKMIDPDPAIRPMFSECRQLLSDAYPS